MPQRCNACHLQEWCASLRFCKPNERISIINRVVVRRSLCQVGDAVICVVVIPPVVETAAWFRVWIWALLAFSLFKGGSSQTRTHARTHNTRHWD